MRSRTAVRAVVSAVAGCALAAGCTASHDNTTEPTRTTALPQTQTPTPTPTPTPLPADFGTEDSRIVRCVEAEAHVSPVTAGPPNPQDVTVGPLTWKGLKDRARSDREGFGTKQSDGWHYKIGVEITAGASATVSVAPQARGKAGLAYGQQWDYTAAQEVAFHACPKARTGYIGGFVVADPTGRSCLPLDIRTGEAPPRRITVSLGAGTCPD
ncbi:hypothetical protein [Streptomyces sp. NPDC050738]|uniref:hypothetical protein n=1 Tax=Streptomyces sp. NPDC050738 TaxID=3154744 RepID=UPI0034372647